jgi:hypothetical protein
MSTLLRALLIWSMVLALPLQGVAAAAMQHVYPNGVAMLPSEVVVVQPIDRHAHTGTGVQDPCPGHASVHAGPAGALAVDIPNLPNLPNLPGGPDDGDSHAFSALAPSSDTPVNACTACSACAACCAAVGIAPRPVSVSIPSTDAPGLALPVRAFESFVPSGLERPPRLLLA